MNTHHERSAVDHNLSSVPPVVGAITQQPVMQQTTGQDGPAHAPPPPLRRRVQTAFHNPSMSGRAHVTPAPLPDAQPASIPAPGAAHAHARDENATGACAGAVLTGALLVSGQAKGILNISDRLGQTVGTGFYDDQGRVTLVLDRVPTHTGRVMLYNRTPQHAGATHLAAAMNIRDSAEGHDHLRYLGKLRATGKTGSWWGDLNETPRGKDARGLPRAFACRPPAGGTGAQDKVETPRAHRRPRAARTW